MSVTGIIATAVFAVVLLALALLRRGRDTQQTAAAWHLLQRYADTEPQRFDPAMLANLPEPARRFFNYAIMPGTPMHRVVEIEMGGQIGLGTNAKPNYRPMRAHQLLAPPYGLVWKLNAGFLAGSDGLTPETSWTRFWLADLAPVVRVAGTPDHRRSAFGRVIAEAAIWAPAALLCTQHVHWETLDHNTVRATVSFGGLQQSVDIHVAQSGQPTSVVIQRWSNENAHHRYQLQPFGGELSGFENVGGFRLPTIVTAGNHYGTPDYFPFFKTHIIGIKFPRTTQQTRPR